MQVILMLSTDLDGGDDRDRASLDSLLTSLIGQLGVNDVKDGIADRNTDHEMQLVILRHVSILMSRDQYYKIFFAITDPENSNLRVKQHCKCSLQFDAFGSN